MIGHQYALCDAVKAAVLAAEPTWLVNVVFDAMRDAKSYTVGKVEVDIGPLSSHEQRGMEETGGASRKRVDAEIKIAVRLRCRVNAVTPEAQDRAQAIEFDKVVRILQRRSGFDIPDAGTVAWKELDDFSDVLSLREDRLVSIVGEVTFTLFRKST